MADMAEIAIRTENLTRDFSAVRAVADLSMEVPAGIIFDNGRLCIELRGEADIAPLVRLMVSVGAEVEEVRKGRVNLEEVFLTLMEEEEISQVSQPHE